jgi:hypothetical protein
MLESIMAVAAFETPPRYRPRTTRDEAMLAGRTCYDHLAGRLGVAVTESMVAQEHLVLGDDAGEVTDSGIRFLRELGLDVDALPRRAPRIFCRPCIDWTERRAHIAGLLGATLTRTYFDLGWIERRRDSRAVAITASGRENFRDRFGLDLTAPEWCATGPRQRPSTSKTAA